MCVSAMIRFSTIVCVLSLINIQVEAGTYVALLSALPTQHTLLTVGSNGKTSHSVTNSKARRSLFEVLETKFRGNKLYEVKGEDTHSRELIR